MTGKFIRVRCSDCGNEQMIFNRASTTVNCHICGGRLAEPTGGLARIKGEIIDA